MTSLALCSGVYVLRVMVKSPFHFLTVFYHVHDIFSSGGLKLRDHYIPNIESLKAISKFFSVSIDELLSGEEILKIADEDNKQKEKHTRDLVFGLLDCSLIMFLFLPFFGQKGDEIIKEVSLLSLTGTPQYIKIPYLIIVFGIVLTGVLLLALQNYEAVFWLKHKHQISIVLSTVATIEFMITLQPYAAFFTFVFLAIKSLMLIKWR